MKKIHFPNVSLSVALAACQGTTSPKMSLKQARNVASSGARLAPGAIYRATAGEVALEFQIDSLAKPGPGPVVGRLLRL